MTWAKRYNCCRYCSSSDIPHKSRGLCRACYKFMLSYVSGKNKDREMAPFFVEEFNRQVVGWRDR